VGQNSAVSSAAHRRRGRPLKLTPEVADRIVGLVRAGNDVKTACGAAGVPRRSVTRWLARYPWFRERVDRARAEGEASLVTRLALAARDDPWAAAKLLELAYPEHWTLPRLRRPPDPLTEPEDPLDAV
jgi:transposase